MAPLSKKKRFMKPVRGIASESDYLRRQEESRAKLGNRWLNVFDKYSNIPDEETDEIDVRTGKIVVDRGHYRRLGVDEVEYAVGSGHNADAQDDNSEDELAPPMPPKPSPPKEGIPDIPDVLEEAPIQEPSQLATPIANPDAVQPLLASEQTQLFLNSLVQTSQLPQTPQTPQTIPDRLGGLLSSLQAMMQQVRDEAVSETLARVQAQPNHPGSALTNTNTPSAPTARQDTPPPTDPKWHYPRVPEYSVRAVLAQSSPLPAETPARKRKRVDTFDGRHRWTKSRLSPKVRISTCVPDAMLPEEAVVSIDQDANPAGEWDESDWDELAVPPIRPLTNGRNCPDTTACNTRKTEDSACVSHPLEQPMEETSLQIPSDQDTLERHTEDRDSLPESGSIIETPPEDSDFHLPSASGTALESAPILIWSPGGGYSHIDYMLPTEEDMELLSLADNQSPPDTPTTEAEDELEAAALSDEAVLPSVEAIDPADEHVDQERTPPHPQVRVRGRGSKCSSTFESIIVGPNSPHNQSTPRKERMPEIAEQSVESDSEDVDLVPSGYPIDTPPQKKNAPPSLSGSKLDALSTPRVKREPATPRMSFLPFKTPMSAPQGRTLKSSATKDASKSTPKAEKYQLLKKVRDQWRKQGRRSSGTAETVRRRQNEHIPRKLQDDSEDELAW